MRGFFSLFLGSGVSCRQGGHVWHSWTARAPLVTLVVSDLTHTHFLTLRCSSESSPFIEQSLSYGHDFNRGDPSSRLTHPTMAFLEKNPWTAAKIHHQLRISSHNRISLNRFAFPFFSIFFPLPATTFTLVTSQVFECACPLVGGRVKDTL